MAKLGSKLLTLEGGSVGFWCPGCDRMHAVRIHTPNDNWEFNGNGDRPTFSPSVLVTYQHGVPPVTPENHEEYKRTPWPQTTVTDICHSFVTDGHIQFLGDCTHALAGQTVALPDFDRELK